MRRVSVLLFVIAGTAVVPAANADDPGTGILISGFHGGVNGASAVLLHDSTATELSAVTVGHYNGDTGTVWEGRIVPFLPDQSRCAGRAVGSWQSFVAAPGSEYLLDLLSVEMFLDGVSLGGIASTVQPALLADAGWVGANYGVPVIGQLAIGEYNLDTHIYLDGVFLDRNSITFAIEECT